MRQALQQRRGLLCFTPCQQPNIYQRPMEKPSPLSPPDPRAALGRGPAFYASVLALSVDRVPSATGVSWQLLSPDGTEKDGDCVCTRQLPRPGPRRYRISPQSSQYVILLLARSHILCCIFAISKDKYAVWSAYIPCLQEQRLDVGIHVQCPAGATRISPIHQVPPIRQSPLDLPPTYL